MTQQMHDSCHIPPVTGQSAATEQPLNDVNRHVSSLKTRVVTLKIAVQDVPGVFDAKAPVYLYDTRTDTGQWASPQDKIFQQWVVDDDERRILQLFAVGSLPTAGYAPRQLREHGCPTGVSACAVYRDGSSVKRN